MAAVAASSEAAVRESFEELERQRELITSCTLLWRELSDHFSTLENGLQARSDSLRSRRDVLHLSTERALASLQRRELSIDASVDVVISKVDTLRRNALQFLSSPSSPLTDADLLAKIRAFCSCMDALGFWDLVVSRKKESELLRKEIPLALAECIDPAKFAMDAIAAVFPADRRAEKAPNDYGWACVVILESLVPVLADPELGPERMLVTPAVKERARGIAGEWKDGVAKCGGVFEGLKPSAVHTFLQHVVTFGIAVKEDKEFYRKLVLGFSWRKQMPKLALSLGLEDQMEDMIEELINKGQQLDAINFAYEAGLQYKFPPVPLLKSYLKTSKKADSANSEDRGNSGRPTYNAGRREQSALRAVIKCIEERKLEAEFPPESLQKRLDQLERLKTEKKRPSTTPATKRTRASNGGPMPPAKAGRLTNNAYVSSFPAAPTYARSPSHPTYPAVAPPYPYDRPAISGVYGSRSPPAIRDPYRYPTEEMAPALHGAPYSSAPASYPSAPPSHPSAPASYAPAPINYPAYGGYSTGLAPGYQQSYYR